MIIRTLLAAIIAGLAAGLVMGLIQQARLTPLILEAEKYEHVAHGHSAEDHSHGDEAWSPADGWERTGYTTLTVILTAVGFAAIMAGASFTLGIPITPQNGWVWGLAGFVIFALAPAIGIPPELPGVPSALFEQRRFWWAGCIISTAMGLWGLTKAYMNRIVAMPSVVMLALPHFAFTAPPPPKDAAALPPQLAAHFATASLGANLVMWLVIGIVLAYMLRKFEGQSVTQ